jgi:aryl-alcohol dehydrogenase-like predicted oxidoreductase
MPSVSQRRKLGNSGIEVGPLAFGGNVFGWTADETRSFALLDAFAGSGLNLIDTADIYSTWVSGHTGGESETIIGNWLSQRRGARERVVIATKVGMEMGPGLSGLRRDYILRSADASLRRLKTDYIDLYQAHKDDEATPLEETLSAFDQLVKLGKVRVIGASNYSGPRLAEALRVSRENGLARYESLQPHYNLVERQPYESELEPVCLRESVGVIPYFSLASGFLTGKYRSEADLKDRARGGGVKKYLNDRGRRVLAALDEVAKRYDATPAQVALAWLIARPSVTAPIASATTVEQLQELVEATRLSLDADAIGILDRASA